MANEPRNWQERGDELAADALVAGEPSAWFERLYAEGVNGSTTLAWNRETPNALLVRWMQDHPSAQTGTGRRAIIVGSEPGADAAGAAARAIIVGAVLGAAAAVVVEPVCETSGSDGTAVAV